MEGCGSNIVSAIPVQELDELEKERIRIEAELDVEMRLAQGGGEIQIAGEGGYDDSQQQEKKFMYKLIEVAAMMIFILFVVAVVVKFAGGSDQLRGPSPTPPTNTFAPSFLELEGIDGKLTIDECNGALELDLTTGDPPLLGTTKGAHMDSMIQVCGTVRSNGKGVWYALEGDDGRWLASTCVITLALIPKSPSTRGRAADWSVSPPTTSNVVTAIKVASHFMPRVDPNTMFLFMEIERGLEISNWRWQPCRIMSIVSTPWR
jgi:hypothetical protein